MSKSVFPAENPPQGSLEKFITLFVVVAPFVAVISIPFVWPLVRVTAAMMMLPVFYVLTVQAITISLHRELTHSSLKLRPFVHYTEALIALMSIEGRIKDWCTDHRMHHKFTDKEGDPHSPVEGFFHAHFGWFFKKNQQDYEKWIPKLLEDRGLMLLDELWPLIAVFSFVLPGLLTLIFVPSFKGFLVGVFWGGFVRVFFVHHVTWSINSICHMWGTKPFLSDDKSTNNWIFGIIGFGEGWHNGHHAFPWSARIGIRSWEIDIGWIVIKFLALIGQVESVKEPTPAQIAKLIRTKAA